MTGLAQSVSDDPADEIHLGWPDAAEPFVAVVDAWTTEQGAARPFLDQAQETYIVPGRPTLAAANQVCRLIESTGVARIVSIGDGVVIDTAKLPVWQLQARALDGRQLVHTAIPAGREPYRAVPEFSMFEGPPGTRATVSESWLPASEIALVPELLDGLDEQTIAMFCGDSLVHVLETMLTALSTEESDRWALAAAEAFVAYARSDADGPTRSDLTVASIFGARAFGVTKLGLAHALSRPFGIRANVSHDAHNLLVGPACIRFWSDEMIGETSIPQVPGVEPTAKAWAAIIDTLRAKAGVPATFGELGFTWEDAQFALGMAPRSSGIPNLPEPLKDGDLEGILRQTYQGGQS